MPDISYNLSNLTQAVVRTLSNLLPVESLDVFIPLIREHFPDTTGMGFGLETEDRSEDTCSALVQHVASVIASRSTWPLLVGKQVKKFSRGFLIRQNISNKHLLVFAYVAS